MWAYFRASCPIPLINVSTASLYPSALLIALSLFSLEVNSVRPLILLFSIMLTIRSLFPLHRNDTIN